MAAVVHNVLEQFNITGRLFCVTTDNASNNGTMRKELESYMRSTTQEVEWSSDATKIPCMAHVIQLVVKAMLKAFNVDMAEEVIDVTGVSITDDTTVTSAIRKIRTLSNLVSRSAKKTELLLQKQSDIEAKRLLQLKRDIDIRWNSMSYEFTAAITAGVAKLRHYYTETGGPVEQTYALAAILDPSQKLDIFNAPEWDRSHSKKYCQIFLDYWKAYYQKDSRDQHEAVPPCPYTPTSLNAVFRMNRQLHKGWQSPSSTSYNEAERYLNAPVVSADADTPVLLVWKTLELSYPSVAKMARDILAVPATGTGVERIFNIARDIHEYHRAQMSTATVRESMIVKHYHRYKWELDNHWDNIDHVFGAPDPDSIIEDSDRQVAMTMDAEQDLPDPSTPHRATQGRNGRLETQRKRNFGVLNKDLQNDEASIDTPRHSQRLRR
ncbi:hypothetical protein VC83_00304 [Pseudogymnoascus destructans]|uniref:HAT C-terminal dimerisation domain-containing protein n=1 Tax=Pseudogymnoascus destructans TaxID=655981 RepID=A0A177APF3_9PEZI|nr:uncharacterized protein VC83_00304 [Pseudogymnoascus destructans]OAF63412.1 hypothetical protein VC83_00304 [Pseudogymnoascus destructans]